MGGGVPTQETTFKEVVTAFCTEGLDQERVLGTHGAHMDLYSAIVRAIVGPDPDRDGVTALRFERLPKQLPRFLRTHVEVTPAMLRSIRRAPRKKTSRHGPYQDYYDDELAAVVGETASWLCERFGYRFEPPAQRA